MTETALSYLKPGAVERIFGKALALLVRIGLIHGHFYILEVRGRKTGKTISLPVDVLEVPTIGGNGTSEPRTCRMLTGLVRWPLARP